MAFGAGRDRPGVAIVLTFGTGIGSARLPRRATAANTEFGTCSLHEVDAENAPPTGPATRTT